VCRCFWNNLSHIPLGVSLGVVFLDHMADLCLIFYEASILFSKVMELAYIPPAVYEVSFFPASSPTLVVVCVLGGRHSNRSEVES
jgi:hypothetical protein